MSSLVIGFRGDSPRQHEHLNQSRRAATRFCRMNPTFGEPSQVSDTHWGLVLPLSVYSEAQSSLRQFGGVVLKSVTERCSARSGTPADRRMRRRAPTKSRKYTEDRMTATKTMLKVARGIPAVLLRESAAPTRTVLVPGDYEVLGHSDDKRYVSLRRGADKWTVQAAQLQEAAASPKPAKGDVTWTPHRTLGEARRALRRIESARSLQEAQAFARSYLEGETPDEPNPDEKPSGEPDAGFDFGSDEPATSGEEPPIDLGAGLDAPAGGAAEPTVVSKADWDSKLKAGQAAYMGGTPFVVLQDETTSITALVPVEIGDKSDPAIKDTKAAGGGESKDKDKDEKKADD